MKTLVRVLSFTTVVLAGTTVYFGQALIQERTRTPSSAAVQAPATSMQAGMVTASIHAVQPDAPATATQTIATGLAASPRLAACPDPARVEAARQRLARFSDPVQRQTLAASTRESLATTWAKIAMSMQLPAPQLETLLDVLSEKALQSNQRRAECAADPACPPCDQSALEATLREERLQHLATHLGPAWMPRYEAYTHAIQERVYMDALRAGLKERDALADEEAERLVLALADVRREFIAAAAAGGQRIQVGGAGFNVQEFDGDQPPKMFGPSNWDLTDQFNERLDEVVARHMTPAQIAAFHALRKERLNNARLLEQFIR